MRSKLSVLNPNARKLYNFLMTGKATFADGHKWTRKTFDMHDVTSDCGAPMCVKGFCYAMFDVKALGWDGTVECAKILGLTENQADMLFFPGPGFKDPWEGVTDSPYDARGIKGAKLAAKALLKAAQLSYAESIVDKEGINEPSTT